MPCYVHFWENAAGYDQSLAYDDLEAAQAQVTVCGGTVRSYPFSSAEYNRRTDPPKSGKTYDEALRRKARELADMAGRRPSTEVALAIEHALKDAAKNTP
ncbi:MAG TPA: hypothetical protein VGM06_24620 [Polyangiaceae bacterium]|jgi:hypothetical protein